MSAHTPGPWIHEPEENWITTRNGRGLLEWQARSLHVSTDERDANASLIAAAPDLLEALQSCVEMLKRADCTTGFCCCGSSVDSHSMGDGHSPVDDGCYHQGNAIDAAKAAIAKATKVQP